MTHTLTTSKGSFLFVGLPEGSNEHEFYFGINAPIGSIVIGKLSTLTEDQAREVVDHDDNIAREYPGSKFYHNYCKRWPNDYFGTALDSLRSLMQAERLYTENPIKYTEDLAYSPETKLAWRDNEERTFPDWLIIKVK